jgi:hypothetical protein
VLLTHLPTPTTLLARRIGYPKPLDHTLTWLFHPIKSLIVRYVAKFAIIDMHGHDALFRPITGTSVRKG